MSLVFKHSGIEMGLRHVSEVRGEAARLGESWRLEIESWGGLGRVGSLAKEKVNYFLWAGGNQVL